MRILSGKDILSAYSGVSSSDVDANGNHADARPIAELPLDAVDGAMAQRLDRNADGYLGADEIGKAQGMWGYGERDKKTIAGLWRVVIGPRIE
jgi:hypothetical protein